MEYMKYYKLRQLMSKYRVTQTDLASIAKTSLVTVSKKLTTGEDFKISHAANIFKYFQEQELKLDPNDREPPLEFLDIFYSKSGDYSLHTKGA